MKTIDFSDPYYNTPAVIVADKSMDIEPTPESLAGKIVGIQASTIHQAYAQEYFKDAELKVYQTQDEANQDLFAGRIDATQADSIAMADFVGSDTGSCCEIKGAVADDPAILGRGVGAGCAQGRRRAARGTEQGHRGDPGRRHPREDHRQIFHHQHLLRR